MAEVSSNVVGYYGKDITKGKGKVSMFSLAHSDVSGKDFNFNAGLNVKNVKGTDSLFTSDHVLLWDPTKAGGAGGYLTLWFYDDGAGDCGWCDPDGNYIDDPEWSMFPNGFVPGTAFWFEPVNANEKTFRFLNPIKK